MQKIFLKPGAASQFYKAQLSVCEEFVSALLRQQEKQTGSVTDLRMLACRFAAECESLCHKLLFTEAAYPGELF